MTLAERDEERLIARARELVAGNEGLGADSWALAEQCGRLQVIVEDLVAALEARRLPVNAK